MKNTILLLMAVIITNLIACKSSPPHQQVNLVEIRKYIEKQNANWFVAVRNYDIEALLSCYATDATIMPPNTPMIKGSKQIKAYYERMALRKVRLINGFMNTIEVSGNDSTIYEIGTYVMEIERPDLPVISDTGKYNTIWKFQQDGSLKIYADCWNSNKPLRIIQQKQ